MTGIGNVSAVLVAQPHPKDCELCGGTREVRVAPMRWLRDGLRPAWPNAKRLPCPWPYGADALLSALGVASSISTGPGGVA